MPVQPKSPVLTPNEKKVLQRIADGYKVNEAAEGIYTRQSVKNAMRFIRVKLGADTTCQAVAMALRRRIIE